MKSRAAVLVGERRIELRELDVPETLPSGSALLRVEGAGMCGTDVHQYHGRRGAHGAELPYPVIIGHEPVGRLERLTPRAAELWGLREGDRVAVEPTASCGTCSQCTSGQRTHCPLRRAYSYVSTTEPPSLWGAYADYMVLFPGSVVHPLPEEVSIEDAVFFNPLSAGISWVVDVAETRLGDDVLIIGPGQRGLASVIACKEIGAGRIIVAGRERDRRKYDIARQLGATHVLEDIEVADTVRDLTDGRGVHRVLDFTTAPEALITALGAARQGGTIVFVARHGTMPFPTDDLLSKSLTLRSTLGAGSEGFVQALRILGEGRYPLGALHTHRFGLDEVEHAIRVLGGEVDGEDAIHVTITP